MSDINRFDWKKVENWKYPYKGLNDPEYLKDRDKMFEGHNGWWWEKGWWSDEKYETPMEYNQRKRAERGL